MSRANEARGAAIEGVSRLAPGAPRDALLELLGAITPVELATHPVSTALRQRVELIVRRAVVLATDGQLDSSVLEQLAVLSNACIPAREQMRLGASVARAGAEPLVVATRDLPAVHDVARIEYAREPVPRARDAEVLESTEEPNPEEPTEMAPGQFEDEAGDGGAANPPSPRLRLAPPGPTRMIKDGPDRPMEPAELLVPPRAAVALVKPAPPITEDEFYNLVVADALDALRGPSRDRMEMGLGDRASIEARLLARVDAIAATGGRVVERILTWWLSAQELPGPWCSWVAPFTLGSLAGADALLAVLQGVESLPESALAHQRAAADALAVSPHPALRDLAEDLVSSPHPAARATGVDLLGRSRQLPVDRLRDFLIDANIGVVAAAVRAVGFLSLEDAGPLVPLLRRWLHFPHVEVAWPVALLLLRWAIFDAYDEVCAGGPLTAILGQRSLDVLVLAGNAKDAARFTAIAARAPASSAQLSALARFGHPGAWAYLVRHLGEEELADAAADALATLFGPCVAPTERLNGAAWKSAIADAKLAPDVRYRRGVPWKPSVLAAECLSGRLPRAAVESRLDELTVRARLKTAVDLSQFIPHSGSSLEAACAEAGRLDARYPAGGWRRGEW